MEAQVFKLSENWLVYAAPNARSLAGIHKIWVKATTKSGSSTYLKVILTLIDSCSFENVLLTGGQPAFKKTITMQEEHSIEVLKIDLSEYFSSDKPGRHCGAMTLSLVGDIVAEKALVGQEAEIFRIEGRKDLVFGIPTTPESAGIHRVFVKATTARNAHNFLEVELTLIDPCAGE